MKRYGVALGGLLASASLILGLIASIQPAVASEISTCDRGFGAKVPVLLVHGFNSNPNMWSEGSPSMEKTIRSMQGVYVARPFSYEDHHFDWVTNDGIGPRLAGAIDCLAQTSLREGGAGKVIVVAHSMGGLATRYAASRSVGGRKIADEMGLVVMLGTPNTGSPWATAFGDLPRAYCRLLVNGSLSPDQQKKEVERCWVSAALTAMREGSSELAQLPHFPENVPVRAIAGSVTVYSQYLFGEIKQSFSDDLIVSVSSALAEHTSKGVGDGRFVFRCDIRHYDSYGFSGFRGGQCSHNEMYKIGYIQQSVTNGIQEYLENRSGLVEVKRPPEFTLTPNVVNLSGGTIVLFGKLSIHPGKTWGEMTSKPDTYADFVDLTGCNYAASCPRISFVNLASSGAVEVYGKDPLKKWSSSEGNCRFEDVEGPVVVTVGGRLAQLYRQQCDDQYMAPRYAWIVPGVLLVALSDTGGAPEVIQGALQYAAWK
jgi:pimeloyl-ACP methyl ester carboxylesterase